MTKARARSILARAFAALPVAARRRLRWHAFRGTTILCGPRAYYYLDGKGGGCPAVLASWKTVPRMSDEDFERAGVLASGTEKNLRRMGTAVGALGAYADALHTLDEAAVRRLIVRSTADLAE